MYRIMVEDTFASAHQLVGYEGPCENIHGHTWKVQIFLKGTRLNKLGMLFDFKEAKKILRDIISDFDHKNLNEVKYFKKMNPTAENIAKVFYDELKKSCPLLDKTIIWESEKTYAEYKK